VYNSQLDLFGKKPKEKITEAKIEKKVCEYAQRNGWLTYKFSSPANRGVPDRIFIRRGVALFIEFKAPGKKPTKFQKFTHEKLKAQGFTVHVIDSIDAGEALVDGQG